MARSRLSKLPTKDLQAELSRRQRQLKTLERRRAKLADQLASIDEQIAGLEGAAPTRAKRGGGRRRSTGKRPKNEMSLADALAKVLSKKKPMKVADITDAVLASGYKSSSANFSTIVNQTLIKDKRFKSHSRGHYVLK